MTCLCERNDYERACTPCFTDQGDCTCAGCLSTCQWCKEPYGGAGMEMERSIQVRGLIDER